MNDDHNEVRESHNKHNQIFILNTSVEIGSLRSMNIPKIFLLPSENSHLKKGNTGSTPCRFHQTRISTKRDDPVFPLNLQRRIQRIFVYGYTECNFQKTF
jgi:hypothetical protein